MTTRLSASSYSNTAPLIWSFLYGSQHGRAELILDNAPTRSAELLEQNRVDAALVPVIAYQTIENVKLVPGICVGAKERVRSVCLVTRSIDLKDAKSVALDMSSRTSVALTKILFREFFSREPEWRNEPPDIDAMLATSDAALIIGDPALALSRNDRYRIFDIADLWHQHTGTGFIFAMWMTRRDDLTLDLVAARDEGLLHAEDIAANYAQNMNLTPSDLKAYLTETIAYTPDSAMLAGMALYFELAKKHALIDAVRPPEFI